MERKISLKDGTEVVIREMTPDDVDASFAFFQALPEEDSAYLRRRIDKREIVIERIKDMESGRVVRLVAEVDGTIVADGGLEILTHRWKEHIGEIRLIVARDYQGKGLGEKLTLELYNYANRLKLEEIIVEMMGSQPGVQKIFERLGFRQEAQLRELVKDSSGKKQDLIVMRCPLSILWDTLEEHVARTEWYQKI